MYKVHQKCSSAAKHLKNGLVLNQIRNSSKFNFIHKPVKKLMVANRGTIFENNCQNN